MNLKDGELIIYAVAKIIDFLDNSKRSVPSCEKADVELRARVVIIRNEESNMYDTRQIVIMKKNCIKKKTQFTRCQKLEISYQSANCSEKVINPI